MAPARPGKINNMKHRARPVTRALALLCGGLVFAGCGGGGDGSGTNRTNSGLRGTGTLFASGQPLAGASVRAYRIVCGDASVTGPAPCVTEQSPAATTTTGSDGQYRLSLAPGAYRVAGSGRTGSGQEVAAYAAQVSVPQNGAATLDLSFYVSDAAR